MASLSRTLLVVCPEGHALRVFTCVARFAGWSLGRVETIALPSSELRPDVIAGAVRPLALRWGIPPGTEVALVLPPLVGGVLSLSGRAPLPGADRSWYEKELSGRIPFAFKDIEFEIQTGGTGDGRSFQLAWLPRTVALEFRAAFARLGLVLGEIVHRAELFTAIDAGVPQESTELVIDRLNDSWCFHLLVGRRVLRTSMLDAVSPRTIAERLQLELLSVEAAGHAISRVILAAPEGKSDRDLEAVLRDIVKGKEIERRPADTAAMFLRFWRAGRTGIWLVPDNLPALAAVRRLTFAIAGCGVLVVAALTWHSGTIGDEAAALEAREARIRPQYQALIAKEAQTVTAGAVADAVARLATAPNDLQAALLAVFHALPRSAWVTGFTFEEGKVTVSGRGLDNESVIARMKSQPGVSRVVSALVETDEAADPGAEPRFRLRFEWAPEPPGQHGEDDQGKRPR